MIKIEQVENKINFYWENNVYMGYAYKEVDGYYVFILEGKSGGFLESHVLRSIANKLDEINQLWDDQIQEYFENESKKYVKS